MSAENPNFRDGYLQQGQATPGVSKVVMLTADNQSFTPDINTMIYVGSDSTTATDRTFTLGGSLVGAGHRITLQFNIGSSMTAQLANSGNMKLVSDWLPLQYDCLTLLWDGTYWNELSRGKSSGAVSTASLADASVTVAKLGPAVMVEATGTLSQTQINGMSVTPVVLVAAQGAGTLIVVDEIELLHSYSTAAYANGGDVSIQYTTSAAPVSVLDVAVITATASANFILKPSASYTSSASTSSATDLSTSANKGVEITNATAPFITGNAANIFKYRVRYHVITLLT